MRKIVIVIVILIISAGSLHARLFFVGSLPFLSITAFPQDVLRLGGDYVSVRTSYQTLPWWGDVDEPANRPNESYSATAQNIAFVREDDETEDSFFQTYGSIAVMGGKLDLLHNFNNKVTTLLTLNYQYQTMNLDTTANLEAETNGTNHYIPVDFGVEHRIGDFYAQAIFGFNIGDVPAGLKVGFGRKDTIELSHHFNFTIDGTNYASEHLVWGWSTAGCNHIFGFKHINGDAWFQDSYVLGPVIRMDVQFGATLPKLKFGARYRRTDGFGDQYIWTPASTNTLFESRFDGEYVKQVWSQKTEDNLFRIYGNYTWKKTSKYALNTLLFFGVDSYNAFNALAENLEVQANSRESYRSFVVELNPNANFFIADNFTFDLALLAEYCHTRWENVYDRWNSLIGGSKETYWNTYVYTGDEYWWEDFGYANEDFFDAGVDMTLSVPLYGSRTQRLGMLVMLFINSKFTTQTKTYGTNVNTATDVRFDPTATRGNYRREIWFNSSLGLYYKINRATFRLEFTEPLIYSLYKRTEVDVGIDASIEYQNEKWQNWAVQQGSEIALTFAYDI